MDAGDRPDSPPLLEDCVGKVVRRVWVGDCVIIIDFEGGLTVQIEADEGEMDVYVSREAGK